MKKSMSKEFKIGIVEGGYGQSFGDEEIISDKKRQYSVRCYSTDNLVIKIPKQYYK